MSPPLRRSSTREPNRRISASRPNTSTAQSLIAASSVSVRRIDTLHRHKGPPPRPRPPALFRSAHSAHVQRDEAQVALAVDQQEHRLAIGVLGGLYLCGHILRTGNFFLANLDDHVAGAQALFGGGAVAGHFGH